MRGLVLEGGGVKGAYHIGVLKALMENGQDAFDGYVGTSIGAINSAMLAAGNWERTLEMWGNINVQNVLDMDEYDLKRVFKGKFDVELLGNVGKLITNLGGFIDTTTDKMREYFKQYIDEEAIRASSKDFGLVTYSVPDFTPHYMMKEDIPEGQLYDYVMASSAYPAFKWQKIEGKEDKWFIDGGVYDNMPVNMLINKGYDDIVAIRTNVRKTFMGSRKVVNTKNSKITYFIPSEKLELAIKFTRENIDKYLDMGYYDAERHILGLPGMRYCVRTVGDEDFYKFLSSINHDAVIEIIEKAKMKPHRHHDANLEDFCDHLRELLELPAETPDENAFISFLEVFAALFKVNRFRFYDLTDFYGWIMLYAYEESRAADGNIEEILKKDRSVSSDMKDVFLSLYKHYGFNQVNNE